MPCCRELKHLEAVCDTSRKGKGSGDQAFMSQQLLRLQHDILCTSWSHQAVYIGVHGLISPFRVNHPSRWLGHGQPPQDVDSSATGRCCMEAGGELTQRSQDSPLVGAGQSPCLAPQVTLLSAKVTHCPRTADGNSVTFGLPSAGGPLLFLLLCGCAVVVAAAKAPRQRRQPQESP